MGLGKIFFSRALDSLIINGKEMIITCSSGKERDSLRVMMYKEREYYRRTVDGDIDNKLALAKIDIEGRPCIRVYRPITKLADVQCFEVDGNTLVPVKDTPRVSEIERLIEVMKSDGVPQEEIDAIVRAKTASLEV